jgi:predicted RNase H-like HicB family nuclease
MEYRYTVVLHPAEEGGFWVDVPVLPGVFTQGETEAEALTMAEDAVRTHIEGLLASGEPVPTENEPPRLAQVQVVAVA